MFSFKTVSFLAICNICNQGQIYIRPVKRSLKSTVISENGVV